MNNKVKQLELKILQIAKLKLFEERPLLKVHNYNHLKRPELQIRGDIEDNSKTNFLISQ